MSYLVMARRWRPQRFTDVIGQDHVTKTLQQAIKRDRIAHAYIFTGPRGVGKTTCARLLAKTVNCTNPTQNENGLPEPCNECPSCVDITAGSALDVIEIDGASNNRVEDVRTLRENIKFAPSALSRKVYIIDEVHMLSQAAFNALLKTLEEPPEHALFIFATTEIHKVPATVLSRCQRFDFKRIPVKGIRRQLEEIIHEDKLVVDEDAVITISVKAEGALRDALSILDQLVAYQGDEPITGEVVRRALGLIDSELYFQATDFAATGDVASALQLHDILIGGGHDPREFLHGFQRHVLNLLFLKAGGEPEALDVSEHFRGRYSDALSQHTDEDLLRMGEWAAETEDLLRDALDPQLRLELFLVRIARMDRAVDLGALLEKMGVEPSSFKQPLKQKTATPKAENIPARKAEQVSPPPEQEKTAVKTSAPSAEKPKTERQSEAAAPPKEVKPAPPVAVLETDNDDENAPEDPEEQAEEIKLDTIRNNWLKLCNLVNGEKKTAGTFLEWGAPTVLEGKQLVITFNPADNFQFEHVFRAKVEIRKSLRKLFGVNLEVHVEKGDIPEHLRPKKRKSPGAKRQEELDKLLEKQPVWKEMVQRFDLKMPNNH